MTTSTTFNPELLANLTARFPSSEELFAWLESPEGGRLTVRTEWMTADTPLALIYYSKHKANLSLSHVPHFRSVVWDARTNTPLCAGPVHAETLATAPTAAGPDPILDMSTTRVEDLVDGVMVNMFFYGGAWRLATRTVLGAQNTFYGRRPFADLFWETMTNAGIDVEALDKTATYSWVLQHPDERIVVAVPYGIPRLVLVETTAAAAAAADLKGVVLPPRHSDLATLDAVRARVVAWGRRLGAKGWQGVVLKCADGRRFKFRTDEYVVARALRGNQAKRPFLWLERWSEHTLADYLALYPEEKCDAESTIERFKVATQELFDLYQHVYRTRDLALPAVSPKYRKLVWEAHQAGAGSYFANMRAFMNQQDTARKLWLVNYEVRYGAAA